MPWIYRLVGFASLLANGAVLSTRDRDAAPPPVAAMAVTSTAAAVATSNRRLGRPAAASERGDDGLFHLTGRYAGRAIDFIVDTGASVTVLTPADAATLGIAAADGAGATVLATAGGRVPMTWRRLPSLRVGGRDVPALDVAVVNGGIGRSLLGQDVLAQLGTIEISGDRLTITSPS